MTNVKNGKNPTRRQKIAIKACGLTPENWFVQKVVGGMLHLLHRDTNQQRTIPMGD